MKSFKLIFMQIVDDTEWIDIELKEGLIINKEDEDGTWLIETFIPDRYMTYFQNAFDHNQELLVQVIISKEENDPAFFKSKVCAINKVNNYGSILMNGKLTKLQNDYPALLLEHLLEQGLSGETLLTEFKKNLVARPKILPKKS